MSWAQPEPDSGKRIRKPVQRRCVDYSSTVVRYLQARVWQRDVRDSTAIQPTPLAAVDMLPTVAYPDNPATSFSTKFVHCSTNKVRCSINRVLWTPTGRRLITGSQSGEFTLWNGQSFNFEMILQAHDNAIRSMIWSHNENWMVTGDDGGCIKYWQTNMNNVKANKSAHKEAVRDLSFSSTDLKFCSCSDDSTVKVWDFARCQEERALSGHGWDVKSVDWHPQKSLLVSGAKDSLVKLWDAKSGRELCTLHGHKNTVQAVKWNNNGNWLLTASKDQIIRLYDIRSLKDLESYRGHKKEVTALAWHPFHEELFVSGCLDGSIIHWLVGHEVPQAEISNAHESSVWDLAWHPMGHILCSGSNDHTTKFWCRNRPGDAHRDKYSTAHLQGAMSEQGHLGTRGSGSLQAEGGPSTPGTFLVGGPVADEGTIPGVGLAMSMLQSTMEAGGGASNPLAVVQPRGPHPPSSPHPSTVNSSIPSYQQHSSQFGQQNQQNQLHQMPQTQHLPDFSQPGQQHLALSQSQLRLTPPLPQQSSFLLGGPPTALSSQSLLSRPAAAQVGHPSSMSLGGIGIQGPPVRPGMAPTAPLGMALAASAPGSNIGIDLLAGNAGLLASQLGIGGRLFRSNIVQGRIAALSPLVPYGGSVAPLLPGQLVPVLPPFQANATNNLDSAHGQVLGMTINIPQHHQHGPGQHL